MKHRGTVLLSVLSFVLIFSAFETYRYLNYVQRQQVYQALISDYRHSPKLQPVRSKRASQTKAKQAMPPTKTPATHRRGSSLN